MVGWVFAHYADATATRGEARLELGEDEPAALEALGYIDADPLPEGDRGDR
jgi:hypothetical protein